MSDSRNHVERRLTEYLESEHQYDDMNTRCECGWYYASLESYGAHLASAVLDFLQITEEWATAVVRHDGYVDPDTQWTYDRREDAEKRNESFGDDIASRLVSPWVVQGSEDNA